MTTLLQDLRYALRTLRRSPGFVTVALLTLGLGTGANIAIFTLVSTVLWRPLPYPHPERLVRVFDDLRGANVLDAGMSVPEMDDLRDRSGLFEEFTAVWPVSASLLGGQQPERIEVLATGTNYFRLLGAKPALGRLYGDGDGVPGFSDPVVISDGLWRRQFGGDPHVLGKVVRMDTDAYTIVGVMPPDFRHPGNTVAGDVEMWSAAGFRADPFPHPPIRNARMLPGAIGRLKPGMSLEQAQSRLDAMVEELSKTYPQNYPAAAQWRLRLVPVQENLSSGVRPILVVLLAAVGLVLLIACANIAGLLLARSSARTREIAIRQALGASRGRLIQQFLTESVLIALGGGAAALAVLALANESLIAMLPADLPRLSELHYDWRVVVFAFLLSLGTGILFGLAPAWQTSRVDANSAMNEGGRSGGAGLRQSRFRSVLVGAEIALSLVLLIAAGLLVRSFRGMLQVNPGLDPKNSAVAQIWIPVPNNPAMNPYRLPGTRDAFMREVLRKTAALPGVEQVAMGSGNSIPFVHAKNTQSFFFADDKDARQPIRSAEFASVSPDYFGVLKTPLVKGRVFNGSETRQDLRLAVVNEAFVRRFSPNDDVLLKRMRFGNNATAANVIQIIGVVGDIRDNGLDVPAAPHVYFSLYQGVGNNLTLFLRTSTDAGRLKEAVTQTVHSIDPTLPVFGVRTVEELLATSMQRRKFVLFLMAVFAVMAMLLAAIGIYGLMAYAVSQRTREIGIRMALGAQARDIVVTVLRPGMTLTIAGLAAGLVGAVAAGRAMTTLLFGVSPVDPLTFLGVPLMLVLVALAACWFPARRAMGLSPIIALRHD